MSTVLRATPTSTSVGIYVWSAIAIVAVGAAAASQTGIDHMVNTWLWREEYSHALLIPLVSAYLLWQQRAGLLRLELKGSWGGVAVIVFGTLLQVIGVLAAVDVVQQYGLLLAIYGLVLAL